MAKAVEFLVVVLLGVWLLSTPHHAHAGVLCEHRGGAHIERHGGKLEDDRFHISRGERVTCDGDTDRRDREPAERHAEAAVVPGHRDHPGFHCKRFHCG
jgi:hypothetical protein